MNNLTRKFNRRPAFLVAVLLLINGGSAIHAQLSTPTYARPMLPGARATALGDAYTAATGDVSMMFWNPAGLAFDHHYSVLVDHFNAPDEGVTNDVAALALPLGASGTFALAGTKSALQSSQSQPNILTRQQVYGFDAAYGAEIYPGLALGTRLHGQVANSPGATATGSWDIGLTYHPMPEISYGLEYGGTGEGYAVTDTTRLSAAALQRHLEIGLFMKYPVKESRTILAIGLSNEKIFGQAGMYYKGGLEILPIEFLALRYGYIFGMSSGTPRYGLGFVSDIALLDYSISPGIGRLRFQQVTLTIRVP